MKTSRFMRMLVKINPDPHMPAIDSLIVGSEKLTKIFGFSPALDDAEVLELHFWRGDIQTDKGIYNFPVLTLKIHRVGIHEQR